MTDWVKSEEVVDEFRKEAFSLTTIEELNSARMRADRNLSGLAADVKAAASDKIYDVYCTNYVRIKT